MKNYGKFGGQYVSQDVKKVLDEIGDAFKEAKKDKKFVEEYLYYLKEYIGRPTPLYYAKRLSEYGGGAKIYLKREDLNHTGAHKINNALGQILLARRMGKKHIICETGAGQHGVATATVCALFNMKCTVFMGDVDIKRQSVNVAKMKMLGAEIKSVDGTLKEAVDDAFNYMKDNLDVFYLIGSAVGPYPYPEIVKYFQSVIGKEARKQILQFERKLPKALVACVGGGSNSIGLFSNFIKDKDIDIFGVEAGGLGLETGEHAAAVSEGKIGIMHGMKTYLMMDKNNEIKEAYSISAGLDYPGVGPEHAYLSFNGRVKYDYVTDSEAVEALKITTNLEGIIPALESSHAISYALKIAKNYSKDDSIIVNLSGRGDKDLNTIFDYINMI
jgi:tryptophan synthase beta chain